MQNIKESFIVSLIIAFIGAIQMTWFLPDGVSCVDGDSSLMDSIFLYMPIQFVFIFLLNLSLNKSIHYIKLILLFLFWLYINHLEFSNRQACWSTFSNNEIINVVLMKSALTCTVCILAVIITYKAFNKFRFLDKNK